VRIGLHRITLATTLAVCLLAGASSAVAEPVTVKPGAAPSSAFPSATGCGCHTPLVEAWSKSMHAQALTDPIYLTKLEEAKKASDGKLGAFCNKCHGPIATMSKEIDGEMSAVSSEGVTCAFCHQTVGIDGKPGNTSQLVETDGVRRAQLKDPQAPHPAQFSEFHSSAEICGGCHNVFHPINGMHLESTYKEWSESPYAEEGVTCQQCHMSGEPGRIGPTSGTACAGGPERDNIFRMSFVGAQVGLGPSEEAAGNLKRAADMKLDVPDVVAAGEEASVTVTITNSGAGHYLPTGLTEVRQMWLEVTAEGTDGNPVVIGERRFGTVLKDADGKFPAELWDAVAVESDDRIPPRESVTADYTFAMPEGAETSKVKAALYYQSVTDEFAKKAGVENPTTEMAMAEKAVYATPEAAKGAAEKPVEEEGSSGGSSLPLLAAGALAIIAAAVVVVLLRRKRA